MKKLVITGLNCVAQRMTEIEKGSDACLTLVGGHDSRFQADVPPNDIGGRRVVELLHSASVALKHVREIGTLPSGSRALNYGVLHDLGPAGAQFPGWQGS